MLVHQYELFKMLSNESITNMFTRMTTITNNLDALSRTYIVIDIIRKLFRLSSKTWETKVTTIWKAKDTIRISLEKLIGSVMTNEITIDEQEQEVNPNKILAFKIVHHFDSE